MEEKVMAITLNYEQASGHGMSVDNYIQWLQETIPDTIYYSTGRGNEEIKFPPINHYPEGKEYEVWTDGYSEDGSPVEPMLWGKAVARNFGEACHKVNCTHYLTNIAKDEIDPTRQYGLGRWDYDPNKLTYWGLKFRWSKERFK